MGFLGSIACVDIISFALYFSPDAYNIVYIESPEMICEIVSEYLFNYNFII
jgi:hypothetical protein